MSATPSATPYVSAGHDGSAHPADGRPGTAPTQAELLDFVRRTAADAELVDSLPLDPEGRTWIRLDGPGGSEAWLIGWPPAPAPAGTTTPIRSAPSSPLAAN